VYWDENGGVIKRERFWSEEIPGIVEPVREISVVTSTSSTIMGGNLLSMS